jgi:hypothetical protein
MSEPFCPAGSCPFRDECAGQNRVAMAALIYAAHGFAVYPSSQWSPAQHHSIGQLPRGEGGWKIATTDIEMVRDGWRDQWTAPDVNVGVATGRLSRLVVVDIDEPEPELTPGAREEDRRGVPVHARLPVLGARRRRRAAARDGRHRPVGSGSQRWRIHR